MSKHQQKRTRGGILMIYANSDTNSDNSDNEIDNSSSEIEINSSGSSNSSSGGKINSRIIIDDQNFQYISVKSKAFPISKEDYDILYNYIVLKLFGTQELKHKQLKGSRKVYSAENNKIVKISAMHGEIDSTSADVIRNQACIKSTDQFVDIGSGIGSVCLFMALTTGCEVVGIEIESSRYEISLVLQNSFDILLDELGIVRSPDQRLNHLARFINCDFKDTVMIIERSTVVFFNDFGNATIQPETRNCFYDKIMQLKDSSHVFVFETIQTKGFDVVGNYVLEAGTCSWTAKSLQLRHYMRNREKDINITKVSCRANKGQNSKFSF